MISDTNQNFGHRENRRTETIPSLGASIKFGEHEFTVPEDLCSGQSSIGRPQGNIDQLIAGTVEVWSLRKIPETSRSMCSDIVRAVSDWRGLITGSIDYQ